MNIWNKLDVNIKNSENDGVFRNSILFFYVLVAHLQRVFTILTIQCGWNFL